MREISTQPALITLEGPALAKTHHAAKQVSTAKTTMCHGKGPQMVRRSKPVPSRITALAVRRLRKKRNGSSEKMNLINGLRLNNLINGLRLDNTARLQRLARIRIAGHNC